ncbi:hypothetical protein D5086_031088, partial [Populus alba]
RGWSKVVSIGAREDEAGSWKSTSSDWKVSHLRPDVWTGFFLVSINQFPSYLAEAVVSNELSICVDPGTLTHVEIKYYDGRNWESSYNQTGIASCSQDRGWSKGVSIGAREDGAGSWKSTSSDRKVSHLSHQIHPGEATISNQCFHDGIGYGNALRRMSLQETKHTFCKFCGITSFYVPRSNPDGFSITVSCVDPGTLTHVEIKHFDGQNWERSYNQTFASCSQGAGS